LPFEAVESTAKTAPRARFFYAIFMDSGLAASVFCCTAKSPESLAA
jgi:hypothetical protein